MACCAQWVQSQPVMDSFHWVDFHDQKDGPTVTWVTQALKAEKWTALREIGVQWDAALVVTSLRATPQSSPATDTYTIWTVSLSKHEVQPLLHAVNPQMLGWTVFGGPYQEVPELALMYEDCIACDAPGTYFTTLHYSFQDHAFRARWMRGDKAAALWSTGVVDGVTQTQVFGLLNEPPGRNVVATWSHFDYGKTKPAEDFVYQYSVDPTNGLEQTQALSGDHAEKMEARLCRADPGAADPAMALMARGQDSAICEPFLLADKKTRSGRRPATGPPANNHGLSTPGGNRPRPASQDKTSPQKP